MLVRWRVKEIAERQGYNAHSLAIEAKLAYNTVRPIWSGQATRADLETIGKLAIALRVQPGDLMELDDARGNSVPVLLAA
jgi:DNA-binding Xre family transcriptional regulator